MFSTGEKLFFGGLIAFCVALVLALVFLFSMLIFGKTTSSDPFTLEVHHAKTDTNIVNTGKTTTITHDCDVMGVQVDTGEERAFKMSGTCGDVKAGKTIDFVYKERSFLFVNWSEYDTAG